MKKGTGRAPWTADAENRCSVSPPWAIRFASVRTVSSAAAAARPAPQRLCRWLARHWPLSVLCSCHCFVQSDVTVATDWGVSLQELVSASGLRFCRIPSLGRELSSPHLPKHLAFSSEGNGQVGADKQPFAWTSFYAEGAGPCSSPGRRGRFAPGGVCERAMRGTTGPPTGCSPSPTSDLRKAPLNLTSGGMGAARQPTIHKLSARTIGRDRQVGDQELDVPDSLAHLAWGLRVRDEVTAGSAGRGEEGRSGAAPLHWSSWGRGGTHLLPAVSVLNPPGRGPHVRDPCF